MNDNQFETSNPGGEKDAAGFENINQGAEPSEIPAESVYDFNTPVQPDETQLSYGQPQSANYAGYPVSGYHPIPPQGNGVQPQTGYYAGNPFQTAQAPKEQKKPRKPLGAASIIALCLCCALLGGAAGGIAVGLANNTAAVTVSSGAGGETKDGDQYLGVKVNGSSPIVTTLNGEGENLSRMYEKAVPSIAGISVAGVTTNAFGQTTPMAATGSGFIISEDGHILTNSHVIAGASRITVRLGEESYPAEIIGNDEATEVAVLKIDQTGLPALTLGRSGDLKVGDMVFTIGNPLGEYTDTLTVGYVSSLDRILNIDGKPINMMQTDCAINPGNSGGPLFNLAGEVVGITTAKSSGTGIEGIGFVLPIDDVIKTVDSLIQYGYVKDRAQLGISVYGVDRDYSDYSGIPVGVYVSDVTAGSCSAKAGIKKGDVITALGDHRVKTTDELFVAKRYFAAGETSTITVMREGKEITMSITFDAETQPEEPAEAAAQGGNIYPYQQNQDGGGRTDGNGGYGFSLEDMFPFR